MFKTDNIDGLISVFVLTILSLFLVGVLYLIFNPTKNEMSSAPSKSSTTEVETTTSVTPVATKEPQYVQLPPEKYDLSDVQDPRDCLDLPYREEYERGSVEDCDELLPYSTCIAKSAWEDGNYKLCAYYPAGETGNTAKGLLIYNREMVRCAVISVMGDKNFKACEDERFFNEEAIGENAIKNGVLRDFDLEDYQNTGYLYCALNIAIENAMVEKCSELPLSQAGIKLCEEMARKEIDDPLSDSTWRAIGTHPYCGP